MCLYLNSRLRMENEQMSTPLPAMALKMPPTNPVRVKPMPWRIPKLGMESKVLRLCCLKGRRCLFSSNAIFSLDHWSRRVLLAFIHYSATTVQKVLRIKRGNFCSEELKLFFEQYLLRRNSAKAKLNQMQTNPNFLYGPDSMWSMTSKPRKEKFDGTISASITQPRYALISLTENHSEHRTKTAEEDRMPFQFDLHPEYCERGRSHPWNVRDFVLSKSQILLITLNANFSIINH